MIQYEDPKKREKQYGLKATKEDKMIVGAVCIILIMITVLCIILN